MAKKTEPEDPSKVKTSRIVVWGNTLMFENTAYQISNISTIAVTNLTATVKRKRSVWPFVWLSSAIGAFVAFYYSPDFRFYVENGLVEIDAPENALLWVTGFVALVVLISFVRIVSFQKEKSSSRTFLLVEMCSGSRTLFSSSDKGFITKAAVSLSRVMSTPIAEGKKMIVNFDNRKIDIEKAEHSNIIGGNVSDSIVNSI
jgi:hypothetical protein